MSGDMKEHVFVWLQHQVPELKREVTRLYHLLGQVRQRVVDLELAMPVNMDGDTSIPCSGCGAKMTFTREALRFFARRSDRMGGMP